MEKWLNYHHLYYFKVIATEGSIASASKALSVGQPALSSQLKQLEANLGYSLFERKNRSLILTEAGDVALKYAEEIFRKGEELIQTFNNKSFTQKSNYRVGVADSVPKTLVIKLIDEVQTFSEETFVSVTEGTASEMISKLMSNQVDVLLTNSMGNSPIDNSLVHPVGKSQMGIYGAKKFLKLKKNYPKSLSGCSFILPPKHSEVRYRIEHYFTEQNLKYDLVAEVQDSSLKKLMAEAGKSLIFLSKFAAYPLLEAKRLIEVGDVEGLYEEFFLLTPKRVLKNQISEHIVDSFTIH